MESQGRFEVRAIIKNLLLVFLPINTLATTMRIKNIVRVSLLALGFQLAFQPTIKTALVLTENA